MFPRRPRPAARAFRGIVELLRDEVAGMEHEVGTGDQPGALFGSARVPRGRWVSEMIATRVRKQ